MHIHILGAMFGASMGANLGAKNAVEKVRKDEMARLGVTQEMLGMAREVGESLERSTEGLRATQESLETQQRLARRLDDDSNALYEKAKAALSGGNEEEAKQWLLERTRVQDKLKTVLVACAAAKQRFETMGENVKILEQRALEVDAMLRRTVSAKAVQDTNGIDNYHDNDGIMMGGGLSLSKEDPLLQKFRDLGIK